MFSQNHAEKLTGFTALVGGIISSITAMNAQSLAAIIGAVLGAMVALIAVVANIMITIYFKRQHLKMVHAAIIHNTTPDVEKNMCSVCPLVAELTRP